MGCKSIPFLIIPTWVLVIFYALLSIWKYRLSADSAVVQFSKVRLKACTFADFFPPPAHNYQKIKKYITSSCFVQCIVHVYSRKGMRIDSILPIFR